MAFLINTTTVITDARALNNVTAIDATSAASLANALMTQNTVESGTTIRASRDAASSSVGTGAVGHSIWGVRQKGTINFYFEIVTSSSNAAATGRLQRWRNGATSYILTQTTLSTSYVAFNTVQSVLPGDFFQLQIIGGSYFDGKNTVTTTGTMRNVRVRTSSTTVYIPVGDPFNSTFWYTEPY